MTQDVQAREEMICSILVIFIPTSCVCAGSFVVNVTQSWYHAEENHNISLEWMFPTSTDHSTNSFYITCEMLNPDRPSGLFHLYEGVEVIEFQDERFAGRVQWDKDVLREGRLRLHISRLQTNDSGLYLCEVFTSYGKNFKECHLNVTAVKNRSEPETTSDTSLRGDPRGRISVYCALGLAAALLVVFLFSLCIAKEISDQQNKRYIRISHWYQWKSTETALTQGAQLMNALNWFSFYQDRTDSPHGRTCDSMKCNVKCQGQGGFTGFIPDSADLGVDVPLGKTQRGSCSCDHRV